MSIKIGFIGIGKLGLPCAEVMADHYEVEGFDIHAVRPGNFRMVGDMEEVCWEKDFLFIAVPTPHELAYGGEEPSTHLAPRDFDYGAVKEVLGQVRRLAPPGQLVVLISTVLPGTIRTELSPIVDGLRLIYNPYLIAMGSVKRDMVNPEMVIIGTENPSVCDGAGRLIDLYRPLMSNDPRIEIGTWEEAECIKIFYNTFISAKISLVNMIQDVAERIGNTNVDVVTDALKRSYQRITGPAYMTAGMGDGGACHPRDNIALRWLARNLDLGYDLFGAIMESREAQASNLATRLVQLARRYDLHEIWIHGKAYKPLVSYTYGSYSMLVAHYIRQHGMEVHFVDPMTGDNRSRIRGVVLLAHSSNVTYGDQDVMDTDRLYCEVEQGSVIIDPWRAITPEQVPGCSIVHYGDTREYLPVAAS